MDAIRVGRQLRALRLRRRWRQIDVADRVGISRASISNLEGGRAAQTQLALLTRVAAALGAELDVRLRWRGEQLDRLLDEEHAGLTNAFVALLERRAWQAAPEVTFAIYGDRGSVDILAFHRRAAVVLVVEIKTVIADVQAMLTSLDRKTRRAKEIAVERGWRPRAVARLLVVAEGSTNRARVSRLDATLRAAFPDRGQTVRDWLRRPNRPISGLLFISNASGTDVRARSTGVQRVRRARPSDTPTSVTHGTLDATFAPRRAP